MLAREAEDVAKEVGDAYAMPLDGACLGLALCPDVIRMSCENGAAFRAKAAGGRCRRSRPYSKRLQTQLETCGRPHPQAPRNVSKTLRN